jgi:hypothetical protein
MKLEEETIIEIPFADGGSESVLRLAMLMTNLRRKKKRHNNNSGESQQKMNHRLQQGGLPAWGPPQGRHTNIHPFVGPAKGVKNVS